MWAWKAALGKASPSASLTPIICIAILLSLSSYIIFVANLYRFPKDKQQKVVQQRKLLYTGLYLLIWGEAANLRFMPECLCYIYHHVWIQFQNFPICAYD